MAIQEPVTVPPVAEVYAVARRRGIESLMAGAEVTHQVSQPAFGRSVELVAL